MRLILLSILFVTPFFTLQSFAQNEGEKEIVPMGDPLPDGFFSTMEEFNSDGTYVKTRKNGDIIQKGYHVNRQLDGELTTYNDYGSITKIENYKKGVLDGITQTIYDSLINIKHYSQGNQIDYETVASTRDLTHPTSKMGPFFTGEKKSHTFTIYKEVKNEESTIYTYDTLTLLSQKQPILKRLCTTRNFTTLKIDTLFIAECAFLEEVKEFYTSNDIRNIITNSVVTSEDLGYRKPNKKTELKAYYKDGKTKWHITPTLRLTYYPSGQTCDSIVESVNNPYYLYHYLENGALLFYSTASYNAETNQTSRYYDYYSNGKPSYTISSINFKIDRVTSTNDSILASIKKGEFIDYYGTHHMTQADGKIDTFYTKDRYPYRYTHDLPNGNFYYFTDGNDYKKITIDKKDIFITRINLSTKETQQQKKQNVVYKIDSIYHIYESISENLIPTKLCFESKSLYVYDFYLRSEQVIWQEQQLFQSSLNDTLGIAFKTPVFTESDYQKALKLAPISSMNLSLIKKCLLEYYETCKEENKYGYSLNDQSISYRRNLQKLHWIFYKYKINPFFTKNELSKTIKSNELTDEEKKEFKKLLDF